MKTTNIQVQAMAVKDAATEINKKVLAKEINDKQAVDLLEQYAKENNLISSWFEIDTILQKYETRGPEFFWIVRCVRNYRIVEGA